MAQKPAIAFCFMLTEKLVDDKMWETFFNQNDPSPLSNDRRAGAEARIYSHVAKPNDKHPEWIEKTRIPTIPTGWCKIGLLHVWINLLRVAYADKNNKYFALLSGACIPLYDFQDTYDQITRSKKSRVSIISTYTSTENFKVHKASQWMILNRKCAKLMINMMDTMEGKNFMELMKEQLREDEDGVLYDNCPDETYPVTWLAHKLGGISSDKFKKEIRNLASTYTYWGNGSSPYTISNFLLYKLTKKAICDEKAIFGRKFTTFAAKKFAMKCREGAGASARGFREGLPRPYGGW
jgi:hypothetical protein